MGKNTELINKLKKTTLTPGQKKYVDHLSEDPNISGQKYSCVSFVSPESDQFCAVTGFKIRGSYRTSEEAKRRAAQIMKFDPDFHVYICPVGKWVPYNPDPNEIIEEKYQEGFLNNLVKGYKEQRIAASDFEFQRKNELREKALREGGTLEGQQELANRPEHPVAIKAKIEGIPSKIEALKKQIEEEEQRLKDAKKKWEKFTEEDIKKAEEEEAERIKQQKQTDDDLYNKEELDSEDIERLKNIDISSGDPEIDMEQKQRKAMFEKRQQELRKLQEQREQVNNDLLRVKESAEIHNINKEYDPKINELLEDSSDHSNNPEILKLFNSSNSDPRSAYMTPQEQRREQFFNRRKNKKRRPKKK